MTQVYVGSCYAGVFKTEALSEAVGVHQAEAMGGGPSTAANDIRVRVIIAPDLSSGTLNPVSHI